MEDKEATTPGAKVAKEAKAASTLGAKVAKEAKEASTPEDSSTLTSQTLFPTLR